MSQVLPSALTTPLPTPPLLRYLSVNAANPFNYFNFLLDKGDTSEVAEGLLGGRSGSDLNSQAKKLINYFFLGITLPSSSFWVNLRPDDPGRITSEELAKTDLGRVLLEQDLRLKKDVSRYLHPNHPQGKEYWQRLYSTIGKDKAKKAKITTQNRVWIVPEEAVVLETEDGALVVSAKLKVLLETEYLELQNKSKQGLSPQMSNTTETKGTVPKTKEILSSPYVFAIDKGYLKGLESETPWEKDSFYQQYLKSYSQGEYKLEANLFGLRRMYWSGGIVFFAGEGSSPITIIQKANDLNKLPQLPEFTITREKEENLALVLHQHSAIIGEQFSGAIEVVELPKKQGVPSPDDGLSVKDLPKPTGTPSSSSSPASTVIRYHALPVEYVELIKEFGFL